MIKIILLIVAFTVSSYAYQNSKQLEFDAHVSGAVAETTFLNIDESGGEYTVGVGLSKITDVNLLGGHILLGGNIDLAYTDIKLYTDGTRYNYSILLNLKTGIAYAKTSIYIIGS